MTSLSERLRESKFKAKIIKLIKKNIKGVVIIPVENKIPIRGLPDLFIFGQQGQTAFLEVKKSVTELKHKRTNLQRHFLQEMRNRQFLADFIYPENMEKVLNGLYTYMEFKRVY